MTTADDQYRTSQRARLERALTENHGTPVDELYAAWARRRAMCPIERLEGREREAFLGRQAARFESPDRDVFVAWRHAETGQVMRDAEHFSKPGPGGPFDDTLLSMNGEVHRAFRELVRDAFSPAAIARWEASLIDPLMNRLIDRFDGEGNADLVLDYTSHFPFHVIRVLLGFPEDVHDEFIGLAYPEGDEDDHHGQGPAWEAAVQAFIQPYLDEARRRPPDNLLGTLVQAEIDGERLSDWQLFKFLVLLIPAGADTTFAGASNMWCGLLTNPDQLELVRREPRLLSRAADEGLRWNNSAATTFLRVADKEAEVAGVRITPGSVIACHLSSHNRDEAYYEDPDRFDITRPRPPSGIFGYGPHACLGMHLARAEMKASLRAALDRLPNLRLDPSKPEPTVQTGVAFFASPPSLPVLFDAS
jgi:cytochrome P450